MSKDGRSAHFLSEVETSFVYKHPPCLSMGPLLVRPRLSRPITSAHSHFTIKTSNSYFGTQWNFVVHSRHLRKTLIRELQASPPYPGFASNLASISKYLCLFIYVFIYYLKSDISDHQYLHLFTKIE